MTRDARPVGQPGAPPWQRGMAARQAWSWGVKQLRRAPVARPEQEAARLLGAALGTAWSSVWREPEQHVPAREGQRYAAWIRARCEGQPAAYLTGRISFFGRQFSVRPGLLIPRPETERLVEEALRCLDRLDRHDPWVVELGTGTGVVALTLAAEAPCQVLATDLSPTALGTTWENAHRLGLLPQLVLARGDLWQVRSRPLPPPFAAMQGRHPAPTVDLVVSNPPYVTAAEWWGLAREVRHEPRLALVPPAGVAAFYRRLVWGAAQVLLRQQAYLLLEVGAGAVPAGTVAGIVRQSGFFARVRVARDLAGHPRIVIAER